jgi:uncharacterized membrane protein YdjX (TVP38/TMEM64 family)
LNVRVWPKLLLALLLLAAAVALFSSGALQGLDLATAQEKLRATGALGAVGYVLAFCFLQPLGPSGHLFVVASSLVWPPWLALLLSLVGATLGQMLYFAVYRYLAFGWAQARVPARLRRYERAFIERPLRSVLILRLLTFTWPLAPALLGVSRTRIAPMLVGTLLGLVPGIALDLWLGLRVLDWLGLSR